ncbi:hypothetical protein HHK36_007771 [Tetracentron sinense]|uniref:Uncharacterized protein n=1 Tax=Tetracentron sinense TaxID=13715 RepID=A0A835DMS0_TETSI|nr:hypothetical protein HHK36_007771 [Tetracentron sinense]
MLGQEETVFRNFFTIMLSGVAGAFISSLIITAVGGCFLRSDLLVLLRGSNTCVLPDSLVTGTEITIAASVSTEVAARDSEFSSSLISGNSGLVSVSSCPDTNPQMDVSSSATAGTHSRPALTHLLRPFNDGNHQNHQQYRTPRVPCQRRRSAFNSVERNIGGYGYHNQNHLNRRGFYQHPPLGFAKGPVEFIGFHDCNVNLAFNTRVVILQHHPHAQNLPTDHYLRCHMDEQGWDHVGLIARYPRAMSL